MKLFGVLDEKKNMDGYVFGCFQWLEKELKKILINEKREKKNWCSERKGYCPLYCKTRFVLQGLKCIVT